MTYTVEQVDAWRQADAEHEHLEFKEAKNQLDNDRLNSYCVAIANEGGGVLLLGIADKAPRPVVGTNAFNDPSGISAKLFAKLGFRVDVEAVDHPDGRVVVFTIPPRPRGTAFHLDGKYLMRSRDALVPMSEDRLRSILAEGQPDWLSENALTVASSDRIIELLSTQTYFELIGLPYPSARNGVVERFVQERLISVHGRGFAISNLGALLFAKDLGRFDDLARKAPRVIVYEGTGKAKTKRDQVGSKGYAVAFEGLVQYVLSQLPANEVIEQALRREMRMFPPVMIRETIANALIHQDFQITGASVSIEIYDDRIEISNPGQPAVDIKRFIDEYRSRNERLAELMRRMRVCEEKGSGIDKVVDLAEDFQLPAPNFHVDDVRTTCTLYGHRDFSLMDRADRIRACYQHSCLRRVMNATMTNSSLRKRFGLPDERAETASRVLRDTLEEGLVRVQNPEGASRKHVRYVPFWA